MGLDMYLNKEIYVGGEFEHRNVRGVVSISINDKKFEISPKKISYISLSTGYWRKANHIHRWFVENVQDGQDDCRKYWVPDEKLKELRDLCQKILDDHSLAQELLPTASGFFFGSTNYDEYYFEDLELTINIIDDYFNEGLKGECFYHSSW